MGLRRVGIVAAALVGLLTIWVAVIVLASLIAKGRVPVKLPSQFYVTSSEGFVMAAGTWTIEGDKQAFPLQTTKIECQRDLGTCTAATAEVSFGETLTVDVETLEISEWTTTNVVFTDDSPGCVDYIYTINVATKSASGVRLRKKQPDTSLICDQLVPELRMTLRKGFDVWLTLDQAALPWFGRLALAPLTLFR